MEPKAALESVAMVSWAGSFPIQHDTGDAPRCHERFDKMPRSDSAPQNTTRRRFIAQMMHLAGVSTIMTAIPAIRTADAQQQTNLPQPVKADKAHFMQRAFELSQLAVERGDGMAYGAVIVKNHRIVGEGWNRIYRNHDATAHGEVEAIRDAGRRLGTQNLSGCEIYTNAKPCPMCATACYWANLSRIYYGADVTDAGAPRYGSC